MSYRQRLCSAQVDNQLLVTRAKKNYYDQDALNQLVPDHAYDEMMDDTEGIGPVSQGELNNYRELLPEIASFYAGGDEVED